MPSLAEDDPLYKLAESIVDEARDYTWSLRIHGGWEFDNPREKVIQTAIVRIKEYINALSS